MYDVTDLRTTIVPKSDQLNAEQLLAGPITVTVTEVRTSASDEQPVVIHYEGENGRPYKPCKTMRKVLVLAWGEDGRKWAGKSMTLFNDPAVKFGGSEVGGIRISHLTDIDRDIQLSLTATRGKKAAHLIRRLETGDARHLDAIKSAPTEAALKAAFEAAYKSTRDASRRQSFTDAKDRRKAELAAPAFDAAAFADRISACTDLDTLAALADELRGVADDAVRDRLTETYKARRAALA